MKTAIILGSSRVDGNTHKLVKLFVQHHPSDLFNLKDYSITPFDYQHQNKNDDFLALAHELQSYDDIVFASPVYWYSMSAQMKVFFDRLSDFLTIEKTLGRAFRSKGCSVLATGAEKEAPECFVAPFKLSSAYLGMNFTGIFYSSCPQGFDAKQHSESLLSYIDTQDQY